VGPKDVDHNDTEMDQHSTHMCDSKAAHFSQSSMADRSYTWPSAVNTGSVITSSVIEHIDLHGTFPSELHGAAHTQMRTDENRCSEMSGRPRTGLTNPALRLRMIPAPAQRHSPHVRALRSACTSMHDTQGPLEPHVVVSCSMSA
jgi:hypothetical protein